ncbi:MAG: hypothetical protein AAGP08_13385 [Pseudomonadota bacterium]
MTPERIRKKSEHLADLIEARLRVRGKGLEAKLARAPRAMPKWVRREAMRFVEAERLLGHPKLMMQSDPEALGQAYRKCEAWLKSVDPSERRKSFWLGLLATNAFNLLLVGAALLVTLRLTGLV